MIELLAWSLFLMGVGMMLVLVGNQIWHDHQRRQSKQERQVLKRVAEITPDLEKMRDGRR